MLFRRLRHPSPAPVPLPLITKRAAAKLVSSAEGRLGLWSDLYPEGEQYTVEDLTNATICYILALLTIYTANRCIEQILLNQIISEQRSLSRYSEEVLEKEKRWLTK
jgi:hypothetical protein